MRRTMLISIVAASALGLSGCGNPFDASDLQAPIEDGPPSFGEIHDDAFEAMLSAESVTITAEVEAGEANLGDLFDGIDDDAVGDLRISGALDGTNSEMSFAAGGLAFTQRAIEGEEYFRGEDFASLLVSELDDEVAEVVEEAFVEDLVEDQWVQFTDGGGGSVFSAEDFITTWQEELDSEDIAEMSGDTEEREGQQVWVYTADGGETEFVISAEGEPYLISMRDDDAHYEFTEWNSSDAPEVPENIITLDEIFEAIAEEQGWPLDDNEENGTDDVDST